MLVKALLLIQICLAFIQAEPLSRYRSQTTVEMHLPPNHDYKVCKCSGSNCRLDLDVVAKICEVFKKRFVDFAQPQPYFIQCDFTSRACKHLDKDNKPTVFKLQITFDEYDLRRSPLYIGQETGQKIVLKILEQNQTYPLTVFDKKPVYMKTWKGHSGIPYQYEGILNVDVKEFPKYELCVHEECHTTINKICNGFSAAFGPAFPQLMKHYEGCHVRHIYLRDNQIHVAWAMSFHFQHLVNDKVFTSMKQIQEFGEKLVTTVKKLDILKSFRLTGFEPIDFIELELTSPTTEKFEQDMSDPGSIAYHINTESFYDKIMAQLRAGDDKVPSCLRNLGRMNLINDNGMVKLSAHLWYSMNCFREKGIKNHEEMRKYVAGVWEKGSRLAYNDYVPKLALKTRYLNA